MKKVIGVATKINDYSLKTESGEEKTGKWLKISLSLGDTKMNEEFDFFEGIVGFTTVFSGQKVALIKDGRPIPKTNIENMALEWQDILGKNVIVEVDLTSAEHKINCIEVVE